MGVQPGRFKLAAAGTLPPPPPPPPPLSTPARGPTNTPVHAEPFGLTVPFARVEFAAVPEAEFVVTPGIRGTVVKLDALDHPLVPLLFVAFTRQK